MAIYYAIRGTRTGHAPPVSRHDECGIKNEKFCIKNEEESCIYNDEPFAVLFAGGLVGEQAHTQSQHNSM